jgi:hypothetical protein
LSSALPPPPLLLPLPLPLLLLLLLRTHTLQSLPGCRSSYPSDEMSVWKNGTACCCSRSSRPISISRWLQHEVGGRG